MSSSVFSFSCGSHAYFCPNPSFALFRSAFRPAPAPAFAPPIAEFNAFGISSQPAPQQQYGGFPPAAPSQQHQPQQQYNGLYSFRSPTRRTKNIFFQKGIYPFFSFHVGGFTAFPPAQPQVQTQASFQPSFPSFQQPSFQQPVGSPCLFLSAIIVSSSCFLSP